MSNGASRTVAEIAPRPAFVAALFLAITVQGIFHALALIPDGDIDGAHLYHGWLVVTGHLSLYADQMTGHRTPLAYWLIGASQLLGPSLLAGRLVSFVAGLAGIALLWRATARQLGESVGALALALLGSAPYILAHFAVAGFHGLAFFWVALGLWCWSRGGRASVLLCAWGLFLTRPQFGLAIPAVWLWARRGGPGAGLNLALWGPGLAFLALFQPWKMSAYVPGLSVLAEGFGWVAVPIYGESHWIESLGRAAWLAGRSYKGWIVLALAVLILGGRVGPRLLRPERAVLWGFTFLALSQFVAVPFPKVAVGYFPVFAPLLAVPLAAGSWRCLYGILARRAIFAPILGTVLLLGGVVSPPPQLPLSVDWRSPALVQTARAARELAALVPAGPPVFLFGSPLLPYLAGLRPPVRPSAHLETLTPLGRATPEQVRASGLWDYQWIQAWLLGPCPMPYALVWRDGLKARAVSYGLHYEAALIERTLGIQYVKIGEVRQSPDVRLEVFRRWHSLSPSEGLYGWAAPPCAERLPWGLKK